ncbi:MAG: nucleotidyltransferase domain-containing protein [Methanobrevibacter sp.]|nr:nucleotidyltransferase domain-containing protein [Methanobrevibacter sp.]
MEDRKQLAIDFANSLNHPEIEKIILFGSVARNEDKKESNIDILIIAMNKDKIENQIYDKAFDVFLKENEDISVKIFSLKDYEYNKDTDFILNVEKEGILIGGV